MKRAWILLISLALLAVAIPTFADGPTTTIKGDFVWTANWDTASVGQATQARLSFDTFIDKNNEVFIQLRGDGDTANWGTDGFKNLYNFKVTSDLTKTMGMDLPVDVKLTAGFFDTYFTGWTGSESNAWDFYMTGNQGWSAKLVNFGMVSQGAVQFDVGAGPVNFHLYTDLLFKTLGIGVDGSFSGLAFWASYGDYNLASAGKGDVSIEAKYSLPKMGDLSASANLVFRYGLGDSLFFSALGAAADYSIFHAALGASFSSTGLASYGKTGSGLDHAFVEAAIAPVANTKLQVVADLDMNQATSPLTGIDINGAYNFGATKLQLGYVVGGADKAPVHLDGDNFTFVNGPYVIVEAHW